MKSQTKYKIGIFTASLLLMCYMAPSALLSEVARAFPQAPAAMVQMMITLPSLAAIAASYLVSFCSAVFYKRHVILVSTAVIAVSGLLQTVLYTSLPALLACCAVMGAGIGAVMTEIPALICDYFDGAQRSTIMGIQSAFVSGGAALMTFLGGRLGSGRWSDCFFVYGLALVYLVVEFLFLPKGTLSPRPAASDGARRRMPGTVYLVCGCVFLYFALLNVYNTNISLMVQDVRGLGGTEQAGLAATAYNFAGMLAGLCVGALMRVMGRKILVFAALSGAAGLGLTFLSHHIALTCLGGMLSGIGFAVFMPSGTFFVSEAARPEERTRAIAVYNTTSSLGLAVSPLVINSAAGVLSIGIAGKFLLAAAGSAAVAAVLLGTFRERRICR